MPASATTMKIMKNLSNLIGKSENEIKAFYLAAIETLVDFGATETQAREMVKETFKETVGL